MSRQKSLPILLKMQVTKSLVLKDAVHIFTLLITYYGSKDMPRSQWPKHLQAQVNFASGKKSALLGLSVSEPVYPVVSATAHFFSSGVFFSGRCMVI